MGLNKAKIIGMGSYLPEKVLSNKDLEKIVETTDEWIVTRTGMKERRIAGKNEYTSDMGAKAALKAIEDAKLSVGDIDCILVATLTPDYTFPSTACLIQKKIGAGMVPALDIQAACSGYIYGLSIAKAFVEQNIYRNVLLVASEKLSSIVNYKDRTTCVLFGDGAAASVISSSPSGFSIESISLGSDGFQADLLQLPAGGSVHPASFETVAKEMHYISMNGKELFKHAVRRMEQASKACLEKANMKETDISWLIPHQANERIIDAIAKRFQHLLKEKVYKEVVRKYGNTSASSVGIALDELKKNQKICLNETVLLTAFGAGLTWGGTILKSV